MRLLLDTHIAIWALQDEPQLSAKARALLLAPENELFLSIVSIWEIALKRARHVSRLPFDPAYALAKAGEAGYNILGLIGEHVIHYEALPALHADPFDRLLIAQAMSEPLRLLTHDKVVASYSDTFILV